LSERVTPAGLTTLVALLVAAAGAHAPGGSPVMLMAWSIAALSVLGSLWVTSSEIVPPEASPKTDTTWGPMSQVADVTLVVAPSLRLERLRGTDLSADSAMQLFSDEDVDATRCAFARALEGESSRFTGKLREPDGRLLDLRLLPIVEDGRLLRVLVTGWDAAGWKLREDALIKRQLELQKAHDRLLIDASTDALTGLPNRREFMSRGRELVRQTRARKGTISCLFLDVDHFKKVNDTHGHAAGDAVLAEVGRVLGAHVRSNDMVGRLGGEEFAVLLPDTPAHQVVEVARRIRRVVSQHRFQGLPAGTRLTVSIGVSATSTRGPHTLDDLLAAADEATYTAKRTGRNQVQQHPSLAQAGPSGMVDDRDTEVSTRPMHKRSTGAPSAGPDDTVVSPQPAAVRQRGSETAEDRRSNVDRPRTRRGLRIRSRSPRRIRAKRD